MLSYMYANSSWLCCETFDSCRAASRSATKLCWVLRPICCRVGCCGGGVGGAEMTDAVVLRIVLSGWWACKILVLS